MATPLGAGYITVAFIAARLAAPAIGVTNASASLYGVATLSATPAIQRSATITGKADLTSTGTISYPRSSGITGTANISAAGSILYIRSSSIFAVASLTATNGINNVRSSSIVGIANLTSLATTASSTYLDSSIIGIATLNANIQFNHASAIRGTATVIVYSITPITPAQPLFSNIRGIANILANGYMPNLCECPEYHNVFPLTCGYTVDDLCANVTTTAEYDVPFTLPVFRMHLLATTLSIASGTIEYDVANITSGQFENTPTLSNNSSRDGTLVKTYKRMGCM